jgi:tetratricopeptide (TPR) repeat protein/transcriptional regulator with XRE-family HTH domain
MTADPTGDIARAAMAVRSEAELAQVLRVLRRREARVRRGAALTYREISDRTGWSVSVIGGYFTGMRLPSAERLDELARLLGASGPELGALASARERAAEERPCDQDRAVPRMLPPRVAGFTGRVRELARLDGLLVDHPPGQAAIRAIEGMGGVGKTALAVHWAHTVADRFPDGQLYVNLRGHDPGEPVSAMDALRALIGGLGVDAVDLPRDVDGRARLYRRLLGGRRVLVLLDNAGAADEVRPLVPPPPSTAVVTSRNELSDLVPVDGGRLTLDVLSRDEAAALLRRLVGARADRDPDAVQALAQQCGNLPLALRVAAEHALRRPDARLANLVAELAELAEERRLDAFDVAGDDQSSVRAVLSWSLPLLPATARRALHLLGLAPVRDFDEYGVAALAAIPLPEATRLTDALTRAHLVQPLGRGRYSMHDLVRAHAAESAPGALTPDERHASMGRLVDYYLAAATTAVDLQFPMNRSTRPDLAATGPVLTPDLPDVASASAWLGAERESLVQACLYGVRHGWTRPALSLAVVLRPLLDNGFVHDGLTVYTEALAAAGGLGDACDPALLASIRGCLGTTNWWLGRLDLAAEQLRQAFDENTRAGNAASAVSNVAVLGLVREAQGHYREALACQRLGLEAARSAGSLAQEGGQLINVGYIHARLEEYEKAADLYRQAHTVLDRCGQVSAAGHARYCLATAYEGLGRYDEALHHAEEALAVSTRFGHLLHRIRAIDVIGSVYCRMERVAEALEALNEALRLCRSADNPRPTAQVLTTLGEAQLAGGDAEAAKTHYTEALERARTAGNRFLQAGALVGLGDCCRLAGDKPRAVEYWQEAHDAYTVMGLPAASRVKARLEV